MMEFQEIEQAAVRLRGVAHKTPLCLSRTFSEMSGTEIYLKCENMQKTGSFKVRGAYNKIAKMAQAGGISAVVASSAGNHAQGVAYAAAAVGIPSTIVMPRSAPIAKIAATEGYGARVVLYGDCYDDAYTRALEIQRVSGAVFVHPFDDEDVIAGQGTVAMEIFADLPSVDTVLVPAGGGGLLAGMGFCLRRLNPNIRIIGVQAQGADAVVQTFQRKEYVTTPRSATIADGISVRAPGKITTEIINRCVDDLVTVSDEEIAEAILLLLERNKMVVEPAGAVSLAAALNHKTALMGARTACLLSGGNMDVSMIHKIVERGLFIRGRQMKFCAVMRDVPGSLQKLAGIISGSGANIIMVQYDRMHADLQLDEVILHIACEVSGTEHGRKVIRSLEENGYRTTME